MMGLLVGWYGRRMEVLGALVVGLILGAGWFEFITGWIEGGSPVEGFDKLRWAIEHPRDALDELRAS
jgi:hypothetical protein